MAELPNDLIPLPTMPWSERPASLPLDVEECRTALWRCSGNITEAAKMLKTTSSRLRRFITDSAYLSAELQESKDQMIDRAESNVLEALNDEEDASRRDTMSRFVLGNLGRARGWGTGNAGINIKNSGGTIVVQWADGSTFGAGGGALAGESGPEPIDVTPDEDVDVVGAAG